VTGLKGGGERKREKTVEVATPSIEKYSSTMNNLKNLLIAVLTGLLALSLFTQPAQSAGISKEAKVVQYTVCMNLAATSYVLMDFPIAQCKKFQP